MAKTGNIIATFLIGAAVGVAAGYILATDKDERAEDIESLKKSLNGLKSKFAKKGMDLEEEIYHS